MGGGGAVVGPGGQYDTEVVEVAVVVETETDVVVEVEINVETLVVVEVEVTVSAGGMEVVVDHDVTGGNVIVLGGSVKVEVEVDHWVSVEVDVQVLQEVIGGSI